MSDRDDSKRPDRKGQRPGGPSRHRDDRPGGSKGHGHSARDGAKGNDRNTGKPPHRAADGKRPAARRDDRGGRDGGGRDAGPRSKGPREAADRVEERIAEGERIAKRLARAGLASRREAEALVEAGRVAVNGKVLDSPAFNVMPGDRITLDNEPIPQKERTRLWLFHKPAGLVTTNRDPEGRPTVFGALPSDMPRVVSVGRLDINTEGLLLLTNDGGLARALELPSTGWLRRYRVRVHGKVDDARLAELKDGIAVDGVFYGGVEASLERTQGSNAWLEVGLREGKNREVKNIMGALGLEVTRLIRISYGPFQLVDLPERTVRELKGRTLRDQLGVKLIEESGADFEAPILNAFSNKPVRAERKPDETDNKSKVRRDKDDVRNDALDRLSTSRDEGWVRSTGRDRKDAKDDKKAAGSGDYEPLRSRQRNTHVWLAEGARPLTRKEKERAKIRDANKAATFQRDNEDAKSGGSERRPKRPTDARTRDGSGRGDGRRNAPLSRDSRPNSSGRPVDRSRSEGVGTEAKKPGGRKADVRKPTGRRPEGGKPQGGAPRGGKPSGGKPGGGGAPRDGKPRGGPRGRKS